MTVLDYRPGVEQRPGPAARVRWVGWAIYLAMSWTWCIGMFLPVLLVRDYGIWGWVVFAVPNVIGAAAMGWVLRDAHDSERMVAAHEPMLAAFSFVTVSFQIFFTFWIFWRIRIDPSNFVKATMAVALLMAMLVTLRPNVAPYIAAAVLLVSCVCMVQTSRYGLRWPINSWYRERWHPPGGAVFLAPVCTFGFLFGPYLDQTFHRARQRMAASEARVTFSVGFGVFFLAMIFFTLAYAPAVLWRLNSVPSDEPLYWWLQVHFLVQLAFTIAVHWAQPLRDPAARRDPRGFAYILGTLAVGFAAFVATKYLHPRDYEGGELVYRLFMAFYGLVFPAYVWLCMVPTWRQPSPPTRRAIALFAGGVLLAAPFYWLGFIEGKMLWLLPGLLIVLALRAAVPRNALTS